MNPNNPFPSPTPPPQPPSEPMGGFPQPTPASTAAAPTEPIPPSADAGTMPATPAPVTAETRPTPAPSAPAADGSYPVDYLNSIAAPSKTKTLGRPLIFGLIFGVIILAVGAILFMVNLGKAPDITTQSKTAQARLVTLQKIVQTHGVHIIDNNLRATNTTLGASLASIDTGLQEIMKTKKIKTVTAPTGAEKAYGEKLDAKLQDAYLAGSLDRSYASEMVYQLTLLKTQLKRLKSSGAAASKLYDDSLPSLDLAIKQFSEFAGTK